MNEKHSPVIIIGAGIAGLTAAWKLKQHGIRSLILEAESHVGGRARSLAVDDAIIDYGAQFFSSHYSIIPKLINEIGLQNDYVQTSEWVGLVKNNKISLIHPRKPWLLVNNQILSISNLLRLIYQQIKLFYFNQMALNDITKWTKYDFLSGQEWVEKQFGESVAEKLTAPIINGFYFQSLKQSSASLAAVISAFSVKTPKTMTLKSGIGSFTQKLADQLNVKTGTTVTGISETTSNIRITCEHDEFTAEQVILTTPAPISKRLILNPDQETAHLFITPYSSTILVSFLTRDNWSPPSQYHSVYGFLFHSQPECKIAALTIENNKCLSRKKRGYLINVMLADSFAKQFSHLNDADILQKVESDIEKIFPSINQYSYRKEIFRWPYAMPCVAVGHAQAVKRYRDTRKPDNKIWLAGDYLGFPWTDSAAQTGVWAAEQILLSSPP